MNSIILIGSIGKDIEYVGTESKLGKFSICVNDTKLNKESGEYEKIASNWFELMLLLGAATHIRFSLNQLE